MKYWSDDNLPTEFGKSYDRLAINKRIKYSCNNSSYFQNHNDYELFQSKVFQLQAEAESG